MNTINFVSGGQVGDLIHELYVVKRICDKENVKANLYIADNSYNDYIFGCGNFTFDLNRTLDDLIDLIRYESYINKFEILPRDLNENFINLNLWRGAENANGWRSWTDLLNEYFNVSFGEQYKYLDGGPIHQESINKIVIHHSDKRYNDFFDWYKVLKNEEEVLFLSTEMREYNIFPYKTSNLKPLIVSNVQQIASVIKGCKLFIGNQSMPLAIASALDIPRIGILYPNSSVFYMNEHSYSKNLSWFLSNDTKYNSKNIGFEI